MFPSEAETSGPGSHCRLEVLCARARRSLCHLEMLSPQQTCTHGQKAARQQLPPVAAVTPGRGGEKDSSNRSRRRREKTRIDSQAPASLGIKTGARKKPGRGEGQQRRAPPPFCSSPWFHRLHQPNTAALLKCFLFYVPYLTCHQNIQTHNALGQEGLMSCHPWPAGALLLMRPLFLPIATCLVAH